MLSDSWWMEVMSRWLRESTATAISRSLRSVLPSWVCSASMTPINRLGTRQPTNAGSSINNSTSTGSLSSPSVPGTKPKSNGKTAPIGSTPPSLKIASSSSYVNLLRLPWGVSITTLRLSSLSYDLILQYGLRPAVLSFDIPCLVSSICAIEQWKRLLHFLCRSHGAHYGAEIWSAHIWWSLSRRWSQEGLERSSGVKPGLTTLGNGSTSTFASTLRPCVSASRWTHVWLTTST